MRIVDGSGLSLLIECLTSLVLGNPIAADVLYVTTPGSIEPDFANIQYTKLARPYWPRVDDPFSLTNQ